MHCFVTSCIGHLESIGSMSYADLLNAEIFHYVISNIIQSNFFVHGREEFNDF